MGVPASAGALPGADGLGEQHSRNVLTATM